MNKDIKTIALCETLLDAHNDVARVWSKHMGVLKMVLEPQEIIQQMSDELIKTRISNLNEDQKNILIQRYLPEIVVSIKEIIANTKRTERKIDAIFSYNFSSWKTEQ